MRHVCIVSYDISNPKRWREVYRTMRAFGEHLQLSVFWCDLTRARRVEMIAALERSIDPREDQVLVIELGPSHAHPIRGIHAVGRPVTIRERAPVVV